MIAIINSFGFPPVSPRNHRWYITLSKPPHSLFNAISPLLFPFTTDLSPTGYYHASLAPSEPLFVQIELLQAAFRHAWLITEQTSRIVAVAASICQERVTNLGRTFSRAPPTSIFPAHYGVSLGSSLSDLRFPDFSFLGAASVVVAVTVVAGGGCGAALDEDDEELEEAAAGTQPVHAVPSGVAAPHSPSTPSTSIATAPLSSIYLPSSAPAVSFDPQPHSFEFDPHCHACTALL